MQETVRSREPTNNLENLLPPCLPSIRLGLWVRLSPCSFMLLVPSQNPFLPSPVSRSLPARTERTSTLKPSQLCLKVLPQREKRLYLAVVFSLPGVLKSSPRYTL